MKNKNTINFDSTKLDYESTIESIMILYKAFSPEGRNKTDLNNLQEIIAWSFNSNKKDYKKFVSKLLAETHQKLEDYRNKKDEKEMEERKEKYPNLIFTKI